MGWLYFEGRWGDDALPGGPEFFGQAKWTGGPTGPKFKTLVRENVCPSSPCVVLPFRSWEVEDGFEDRVEDEDKMERAMEVEGKVQRALMGGDI